MVLFNHLFYTSTIIKNILSSYMQRAIGWDYCLNQVHAYGNKSK